ncbi:isochorismatase family cysteine hydrolase [Asaia sp. HN010]|uniref:isochorismatase family cysteine hydrolase n=1 Tax=Asaia sp. HN010 TaxID=3081233 RepID=UPI003015967C
MSLTILDPNSALVVVDLQKGLAGLPFVHPLDGIIERNRALLDAFRAHRLPVVLVNVVGGAPGRTEQPPRVTQGRPADFADLLPGLDRKPDDILVTKRTWGAFASTDLDAQLKALGVTQIIVTGVATGTGVEATARQAYEAGYNVTLPTDAMTDLRVEAHDHTTTRVFPRLGETGLTQDALALLAERP